MTPKMGKALKFIESFIEENGHPPTIREITKGLGLASISGGHRYVQCLIERGEISLIKGRTRSIKIKKKCKKCPNCGTELKTS